jgi:hypothetical protein
MNFFVDPFVQQLARSDADKIQAYGLAICALFHQPKPLIFTDFYHRLVSRFHAALDADEQRAVYFYPIDYIHITIALLINFKRPQSPSPDDCRAYWQQCFTAAKAEHRRKPIVLSMDAIRLSPTAAYFEFCDELGEMKRLRESIQRLCVAKQGVVSAPIFIPNIIHISFLRFKDTVTDAAKFERTFHRVVKEMMAETNLNSIRFTIDEISLAFETRPYLHNPCDAEHLLDTIYLSNTIGAS